jgi:hypothetical protein
MADWKNFVGWKGMSDEEVEAEGLPSAEQVAAAYAKMEREREEVELQEACERIRRELVLAGARFSDVGFPSKRKH